MTEQTGLEHRRETIREMLEAFESSKRADGAGLSMSEYIRLLQIYSEMAEDEPGDLVVQWVDSWADKE